MTTTDLIPSQGILSIPGLELTDTNLVLPPPSDDPARDFQQWSEAVKMVGRVSRSSQWWVGSALLAGEQRFGEVASQYSDLTGYDPKTLMNFIWVCRAVAPERRRSDLTFGHHALVAAQPDSIQQYWLQAAAENQWTIQQLREAMQPEIEAEYEAVEPSDDEGEEDEEETVDKGPDIKAVEKVRGLVTAWYQSLEQEARDKAHDRVQRTIRTLTDLQTWLEDQEL